MLPKLPAESVIANLLGFNLRAFGILLRRLVVTMKVLIISDK